MAAPTAAGHLRLGLGVLLACCCWTGITCTGVVTLIEGAPDFGLGTAGSGHVFISGVGLGDPASAPPIILIGNKPCEVDAFVSTEQRIRCKLPKMSTDAMSAGTLIPLYGQAGRGLNVPLSVVTAAGLAR